MDTVFNESGNIEIQLGDKIYELKPSLEACLAISRLKGGLFEVRRKIAALDFDTIADVIGFGIGVNPSQRQRMLPKLVYEAGLFDLSGPCIDYVLMVGNKGKAFDDEKPGDDQADPRPAS